MPRFLCIRHAQSVMNAEGRWQGQLDPPLTREGRRQARGLARVLAAGAGGRLAGLVASDLQRAWQTACILGETLGLRPEAHAGLRERDVGRWAGRTHAEIERLWPGDYARLRAGDPELRPGGGESRRQLRERVRATFAELAMRLPAGPIAVVTHMGVLRSLRPGLQLANTGCLWLAPDSVDASRRPETLPA